MIERVGVPALWTLLGIWLIFLARYFLGFALPAALTIGLIVVGIAAGVTVLLWLFRQGRWL